jgi:hypothetical protein
MTAQNPLFMMARMFNHLPLALKLSKLEKDFVKKVKELLNACLFYGKLEYFKHNFG